MSRYYCYLLETINRKPARTYIGFTTDPTRRLRQHNREIVGGAKATNGHQWERIALVTIESKQRALSFEWYWKHRKGKRGKWTTSGPGGKNRINRLLELIGEFQEKYPDEKIEILEICDRYEGCLEGKEDLFQIAVEEAESKMANESEIVNREVIQSNGKQIVIVDRPIPVLITPPQQ